MPSFLADLAPLVLVFLAGIGSMVYRDRVGPALALRRVSRGGRVQVPVRVGPPAGARRGQLSRVGAELHLVSSTSHWVVPVAALRATPTRGLVDVEEGELGRGYDLTGPEGEAGVLEVDERWTTVLDGLMTDTTLRADTSLPRRAGVDRGLIGATALLAATSLFFGAVRALSVERTSPVLRTTETDGVPSCHVQWGEGSTLLTGAPDCPDPVPAVGDPMTYLTPPWPFAGQAWDVLGANLLAVAPSVVTVVLVGWAFVQGARRTRRPARAYRPATEAVDRQAVPDGVGLLSLVDHAARVLRWAAEPEHEPNASGPPWRRDLLRALAATPRWPLGITGLALLFSWASEWPEAAVVGIAAAAASALLWTVWRFVSTFLRLHRTWSAPFTSEWTFRGVRDPGGEWVLLLFLGETPQWSMFAPGRPPLAGTALVRGDLQDGGSVHLQIGEKVWLPGSVVLRVTEEELSELREMIRFELTGETTPVD